MALKVSFLASGLITRVYGNTAHTPKNALKFDEMKISSTSSISMPKNMQLCCLGEYQDTRVIGYSFYHQAPQRR